MVAWCQRQFLSTKGIRGPRQHVECWVHAKAGDVGSGVGSMTFLANGSTETGDQAVTASIGNVATRAAVQDCACQARLALTRGNSSAAFPMRCHRIMEATSAIDVDTPEADIQTRSVHRPVFQCPAQAELRKRRPKHAAGRR